MLDFLDLLVVDRTEELKTGLDFQFWLVSFNNGADNGDIDVLGANVVRRRDHGNINVCDNESVKVVLSNHPTHHYAC